MEAGARGRLVPVPKHRDSRFAIGVGPEKLFRFDSLEVLPDVESLFESLEAWDAVGGG